MNAPCSANTPIFIGIFSPPLVPSPFGRGLGRGRPVPSPSGRGLGRGFFSRYAPPATRHLLLTTVLLLLATGLRFHHLDAQSFWNDEGNSARLSERAIPAILEGTASDIHPPLYYLLLHGWRALLGDSEFALRALSAFAGVLTVAAVAALAKRRGAGERGGRGAGENAFPPLPCANSQPHT